VLAHRVVWSLVCLAAFAAATGRLRAIAGVARDRRRLSWLAVSSVFIGFNWTLFIWAVSSGGILESSLGYYINPLFNVLLGALVLGERLDRVEWACVALTGIAVAWLTVTLGVFPVVPLALAASFALYGLVRKRLGVGSLEGLALETALLLPFALGWILLRAHEGTLAFGHRGAAIDLLLIAAGPITAVPLLCFTSAVSRLRLATVGLIQYLSPTLQLLLAVLVYREPFGRERLVAFVVIWIALALFAAHNWRRAPEVTPPE
jgi:chloramphenicol-sensitive protein RarD